MTRSALVTGASGFLGRALCRDLVRSGWRVSAVGTVAPENAALPSQVDYFHRRLPDSEFPRFVSAQQPEIVYHCAGRSSVALSASNPRADFADGPVLTFDFLEILRGVAPGARFVFLSSAAVYGEPRSLPVAETHPTNPISPYGFHKLACEVLCREFATVHGMPIKIARIFSGYGPGLRRQVIWEMCRQLAEGSHVRLKGTGSETRDFLHVSDVVAALRLLGEGAEEGFEIVNVASGASSTIRSLAELLTAEWGVSDQPLFDGESRPGDPLHWEADVSLLTERGFKQSVSLNDGLRGVVRWAREELVTR